LILLYAGYCGYQAASEKVQSKIVNYMKFLALGVLLSCMGIYAIGYRYSHMNTSDCDNKACVSGMEVMKTAFIGLYCLAETAYFIYVLYKTYTVKTEFNA
jgi:hypothetical protein